MQHFLMLGLIFILYFGGCKSPEKERGDEDAEVPEKAVVQDSQRKVEPADIVVPDGYTIEAVATGLSYPVDVTFDDQGLLYYQNFTKEIYILYIITTILYHFLIASRAFS